MQNRKRNQWIVFMAMLLALSLPAPLSAFVNPDFTPLHLIRQSSEIFELRYLPPSDDSRYIGLSIENILKGEAFPVSRLDLSALTEQDVEEIEDLMETDVTRSAMLFVGDMEEELALLLINTRWILVQPGKDGHWRAAKLDTGEYQAVWFGAPDMLARAIQDLMQHPDPDMPVASGTSWQQAIMAGRIDVKMNALLAVDLLRGKSPVLLHVCSPEGDMLLQWNAGKKVFEDRAPEWGLTACSVMAVWGDFTGNRQLDLVSWSLDDQLQLWENNGDGTFSLEGATLELPSRPVALTTLPGARRSAFAAVVDGHVIKFNAAEDGTWSSSVLPVAGNAAVEGPAKLIPGDINGNGRIDLLLVHAAGGMVFYKTENGFLPGETLPGAGAPGAPRVVRSADFDASGRLNFLVIGEKDRQIWWNQGNGRFLNRFAQSGELGYISNPEMTDALITDFNHDGRPDLILANPGMGPHYFFSRGYLVYGFAEDLDSDELPDCIYDGQQAVLAVDFEHRGTADVLFVLDDGALLLMRPDVNEYPSFGLTLRMAPETLARGPVMVSAHDGDRFYGIQTLYPGTETGIGRTEPGPLTIRWRFDGDEDWREAEVILEEERIIRTIGRRALSPPVR